MKSSTAISRIAQLLCMMAVMGTQMFGVTRGYLCDCGPAVMMVQSDHCDWTEVCEHDLNPGEHHLTPCDQHEKSDRREHVKVIEEMRSILPGGGLNIPLADNSTAPLFSVCHSRLRSVRENKEFAGVLLRVPPGANVVRSVVLLI